MSLKKQQKKALGRQAISQVFLLNVSDNDVILVTVLKAVIDIHTAYIVSCLSFLHEKLKWKQAS